ncbi:MAG: hypothetical protein ACK5HT_02315 [Draconibacterium sp.]
MKIISTNIGEVRTLPFNGKEVTTGIFKFPVEEGIYRWIYASEFDPEVKQAINDPNIAASCRKDLLKRWGDFLD